MSDTRRGVRAVRLDGGRLAASCFLLLSLLAPPAYAQSLSMKAASGLEGYVKPGRWLPIEVTLENPGDDVEGDIRAAVGRAPGEVVTRRPVRLASGARQRHLLMVCIDRPTRAVPVRFRHAKAEVGVREIDADDRLVLSVSDDRTALGFVQGIPSGTAKAAPYGGSSYQPQAFVVHSDVSGLFADSLAYSAVDVIALGAASSRSPSPDQKKALREWVCDGGTLVVSGGSDTARIQDPFWQELLPVQQIRPQELASLASLGTRFGAPVPPGGAMVARGRPVPGARVWVEQDGVPLIVSRPYGNGAVVFLAFDYDQMPVRGWAGQVPIWREILAGLKDDRVLSGTLMPSARARYGAFNLGSGLADAVTDVPSMDLPSARVIGFFFLAYLLCLVPLNYIVLRRLDRREYAWATTPAIAALFCLIAYFFGIHAKGGSVALYRIDVVESKTAGGWASGSAYLGLFSPARRSYVLRVPGAAGLRESAVQSAYYGGPSSMQPTRPYTLVEEDETRAEDVDLNMNAMRVFTCPIRQELGGTVTADLRYTQLGIDGEIVNHTRQRFEGGVLCFGRITQAVAAIGPGERIRLDPGKSQALGSAPGTGGFPMGRAAARVGPGTVHSPADRIRRAALDAVLTHVANSGGLTKPVLIAWGPPAGAPVDLPGRRAAETRVALYLLHLEPPGARGGGMTLPSDLVPGRVVDYGGATVYPDGSLNMRAGSAVIKEFVLPSGGTRVEELTLQHSGRWSGTPGRVALSVQDPRTKTWLPLGVTVPARVPRAERFVDRARQSIRVRAEVRGNPYYMSGLSATVRVR